MTATPPYPETRKRKLVTHLVGVPIGEGINAVCVVLWQSRRTRNLMTLGISSVRLPSGEYPSVIDSIVSLIDTSAAVIRSGYWHLGPAVSVDIPPEVSMRTEVGQVWCDDQPLRPCTSRDYSLIPLQQLAGMDLVDDYIRFLDTGIGGSRFCLMNCAAMEKHLTNYPIPVVDQKHVRR